MLAINLTEISPRFAGSATDIDAVCGLDAGAVSPFWEESEPVSPEDPPEFVSGFGCSTTGGCVSSVLPELTTILTAVCASIWVFALTLWSITSPCGLSLSFITTVPVYNPTYISVFLATLCCNLSRFLTFTRVFSFPLLSYMV